MDNCEDSNVFQIKQEELVIKDEYDDGEVVGSLKLNREPSADCQNDLIAETEIKVEPSECNDKLLNYEFLTNVKIDKEHIDHHNFSSTSNRLVNCERNLKPGTSNMSVDETTKLECEECGQCFADQHQLEMHLLAHKLAKPLETSEHKKKLNLNSKVITHLDHKDEKPFKCDQCNKSFMYKRSLARHMLVHTDAKLFKCNFCNKAFNYVGNLNQHTLIHKGEKKFKCKQCNKSFICKQYLTKHMLVHTDAKPFKCNFCNKAFKYVWNLKKHTLIHTGEKPYKCKLCDRVFNEVSNRKRHMLIHKGR